MTNTKLLMETIKISKTATHLLAKQMLPEATTNSATIAESSCLFYEYGREDNGVYFFVFADGFRVMEKKGQNKIFDNADTALSFFVKLTKEK